jgi:hypothetical protein
MLPDGIEPSIFRLRGERITTVLRELLLKWYDTTGAYFLE